jgi:hypothetical protein
MWIFFSNNVFFNKTFSQYFKFTSNCGSAAVEDGRAQHVVDAVGVEDERGVRDVVLAGGLRQAQTLL